MRALICSNPFDVLMIFQAVRKSGKRPQNSAAKVPAVSKLQAKKNAFASLLTDLKRASRYASEQGSDGRWCARIRQLWKSR